jgi:hypothetical protein
MHADAPQPFLRLARRLLGLLAFAGLLGACEPTAEIVTRDASARLEFSADTVYFDTLLSEIPTATFRFQAYNRSKNAVVIDRIALGGGSGSPYKIAVNGQPGPSHTNIRLLGGDSLLVLVSANVLGRNLDLPYVVQDSVVFETNGHLQDVKLVAWGQDAHFIRNEVLPCQTTWTADRPYVVFGAARVDSACLLQIEAGATIYMHNGANLFVRGSLHSLGTPEAPVTFTSVRQDGSYRYAPGQWGAIVFLGSSQRNRLTGTRITNGLFGVYADPPTTPTDIVMDQCLIENMAYAGVWCFNAQLQMRNTLVNNCLAYTVACVSGGTYRFDHCTFANYSFDFFREGPSVVFSNFSIIGENVVLAADLDVRLRNSIVWGSLEEEILYPTQLAGFDSTVVVDNCLMRSVLAPNWPGASVRQDDPRFAEPALQDFRLLPNSPAIDAGTPLGFPADLLGFPRSGAPDLGAFEFQP